MRRLITLAFVMLFAVSLEAGSEFAKLPLSFEENRGQAGSDARFVARGEGYSIVIGATGNKVLLRHFSVAFRLRRAKGDARFRGEGKLQGSVSYLRGSDPSGWLVHIPTFERIRQAGVYPGIDVAYYGNPSKLEYDFIVSPGADPRRIEITFDHVETLAIDGAGNLHVKSGRSEVVQHKPIVYQASPGGRESVEGNYRLIDSRTVAFNIGKYDRHRPLVIDPVLTYSTYLGGSNGDDSARGIATDSSGSVYVTGSATSTDFQTRTPLQPRAGTPDPDFGFSDAFVSKLNAAGTALVYSTYLGGSGDDDAVSIALDASNNVVVTGRTTSPDFPVTANAFKRACSADPNGNCSDAFVSKLNANGSALMFSTYLGGTAEDEARAVAVDSAGNAYVAGRTLSSDFPMVSPYSAASFHGGFVSKLSTLGNLVYSTYFGTGPAGASDLRGIAVDAAGSVYLTSATPPPAQPSAITTATDVFVAKLNAAGSAVLYTNYLRGLDDEAGNAITLDAAGNVYVTGVTSTRNFPTTAAALQRSAAGGPVFKTTDAGANWSGSPAFCNSSCVPRSSLYAIAIAPTTPPTIYTGGDDESVGGLYKSTDGGFTWTASFTGMEADSRVHAIAVDPQNPAILYAGTRGAGVYKSTNGGASWTPTSLSGAFVTTLVIDRTSPSTIYAGGDGIGVYKSANAGATWVAINNGLTILGVNVIALHPAIPSTLFAGTTGGLYKSVDGGATWTISSAGLFDPNINALVIDPRNPNLMLAGTNSVGIFRSVNGGSGWLASNAGISSLISGVQIGAIGMIASTGTLYAAVGESNAFRVFTSTNGIAWTPAGLSTTRITGFAIDPANSNTIYASSLSGTDAFIAKWDGSGTLIYSTLLGGFRDDAGNALAVDSAGNAFVTGTTSSTDFPVAGAVQPAFAGGTELVTDAFVAKLNSTGASLTYATYLGGSSNDSGNAIALDNSGNAYIAGQTSSSNFPTASPLGPRQGLMDAFIAKITDTNTVSFSVASRGAYTSASQGTGSSTTVGFGRVAPGAGSTSPQGMAIFGFRQNNTLVSEAAVPATTAILSGRIYAQVGGAVNTGIAIANPNAQSVTVSFYVTNNSGGGTQGSATIAANGQIAAFLDQAPFNAETGVSGTFTFTASAPVAVVALRGLTNERGEFLITTLPVVDLAASPGTDSVLIPHFADGGGWTTQVVLVNPTDIAMSGSVQFYTQAGAASTSVPYTIPSRGSFRYASGNTGAGTVSGSIRVVPAASTQTPSGVAIFSFRNGAGITVSEAGVPAVRAGAAFRLYTEASGFFNTSSIGSMQTGVAIMNASPASATVTFELSTLAGVSTGLTGTVTVPGNGQVAMFVGQIRGFENLPNPLQGVLRIASTSSPSGIAVVGLRGRYNERGDFLITTTQPSSESAGSTTSELFFPHFADGAGYTTQFVLFNGTTDQSSSGSLRFFSQSGVTLSLSVR